MAVRRKDLSFCLDGQQSLGGLGCQPAGSYGGEDRQGQVKKSCQVGDSGARLGQLVGNLGVCLLRPNALFNPIKVFQGWAVAPM